LGARLVVMRFGCLCGSGCGGWGWRFVGRLEIGVARGPSVGARVVVMYESDGTASMLVVARRERVVSVDLQR